MSGPWWSSSDVDLWCGDSRALWRDVPERSAHAIVTSPPYYGLRDYGVGGQLGLEASPAEYVEGLANLLTAWGERVLRPDGSLWLNLGDSYNSNPAGGSHVSQGSPGKNAISLDHQGRITVADYPRKSLLMIPERVALALIDRGWILRNRVVWAKPNGMPSSVTDRLATKHEAVFHLVRQPKYHYDLDAIKEPPSEKTLSNVGTRNGTGKIGRGVIDPRGSLSDKTGLGTGIRKPPSNAGVNPGDWWVIPTQPYPEAHFAVYPPELVRRPILATVPEHACRACGKGRERITEVEPGDKEGATRPKGGGHGGHASSKTGLSLSGNGSREWAERGSKSRTVGWSDCGCDAGWTSGVVADPFAGAGTTAVMARRLGRRSLLAELNAEYCELIKRRLRQGVLTFDEEVTP